MDEALVLMQVTKLRKHQPRCGGRKLYLMLQPFFKEHEIALGRDKFFALLKRGSLLVRKKKRGVYTTQSKHFLYRYPNLVKNMVPLKAHELWVADITYLPLADRFAYLFLITDAYSRKIVGFHLSHDMKVSSAVVALRKALAQKPLGALVIHHSDRGLQYCSTEYVQMLKKHRVQISMTENADPYENAIAERVNGILKDELLRSRYADITCASLHVAHCIAVYNNSRRHSSLNWQVPGEVHCQTGPQIRQWKNYYQKLKSPDVVTPGT